MAKRSVRKRRRMEAANSHTPVVTPCAGDDCTEDSTTTVNIDGTRYRVCDLHAEMVMIQEGRRAEYLREQGGEEADIKRRRTEEALGLNPVTNPTKGHTP